MGRPRGRAHDLERHRLRAMRLLSQGIDPETVAHWSGVSVRSVYRWAQLNDRLGRDGLRARSAKGRPLKLTLYQRVELIQLICNLPVPRRTRQRVKRLIQQQFDITYNLNHIGRLLRSLGFRPQPPSPCYKRPSDRRTRWWRYYDPDKRPSAEKKSVTQVSDIVKPT